MKTRNIISGPSKYELMLSLFENKSICFELEGLMVGIKACVNVSTLTRVDDDHGYNNHCKFEGWFVECVFPYTTMGAPIEKFKKCEIDFSILDGKGTFTSFDNNV